MLNPATDKFNITFGSAFYNKELSKKYDDFLFTKNGVLKNIQAHLEESIQSISIPGMSLNTFAVTGLQNFGPTGNTKGRGTTTTNVTYPGNAPLNEVIQSTTVVVSFKNTLINWMFIYEIFRNKYYRNNSVIIKDFDISIVLNDAAEIPMLQFNFVDCFISELPGLEFAFNQNFRETKSFDATFVFQKMDVNFLIPGFKLNQI